MFRNPSIVFHSTLSSPISTAELLTAWFKQIPSAIRYDLSSTGFLPKYSNTLMQSAHVTSAGLQNFIPAMYIPKTERHSDALWQFFKCKTPQIAAFCNYKEQQRSQNTQQNKQAGCAKYWFQSFHTLPTSEGKAGALITQGKSTSCRSTAAILMFSFRYFCIFH